MPLPANKLFAPHTLLRARAWQHRSQLDDLCDWWRRGEERGGIGVCSLIGIGGAGKTAVVDRFLQLLPEVTPPNPEVPKDMSLAEPNAVFVFSFYDAPNPEAFFKALTSWLRQTVPTVAVAVQDSATGRISYHQVVQWLQGAPPGLLILDGLEKIQEDGTRGGILGRIADGNLRDFLGRLASGYLPHLSAVITSRFPIADLDELSPDWYRSIDVDQIELQTGIDLLRQRKVKGNEDQLAAIVENCGRHALTVDMAGGLLVEFHNGDPKTNLDIGTPDEIEQAVSRERDPRRRATLRQELRFAKVAGRYRQSLENKDKAALALLERVCLFRLGVDAATLTSIFTGKDSQKAAGRSVSRLSPEKLQDKLDLLVGMGLLEANPSSSLKSEAQSLTPTYTIHPAVRDGFLKGIAPDTKLGGHEAARAGLEVSLEVSLGGAPGENPSDPATLDLLEEIVHHTLQSDHVSEAFDIYWNRIGNYQNLGWRLGAYERGERICRAFAGGQSPESCLSLRESSTSSDATFAERKATKDSNALPPMPFLDLPETTQSIFINEWALYLSELGRLAAAARCHELYLEMEMQREDWKNASSTNQNLCEVWLLSGHLSRRPQAEDADGAEHSEPRQNDVDPASPRFAPPSPAHDDDSPSETSAAPGLPVSESARLGASSTGALATANEALRLAELADDAEERHASHECRAYASAQLGEIQEALSNFSDALNLQHEDEGDDDPLYGSGGIRQADFLTRLGRHQEARQLTEANQQILLANWGPDDNEIPTCQLVLSSLSLGGSYSGSSSSGSSADLWAQARDWALARDAKEVLCWSYLVEAQHALAQAQRGRQGASRRSEQPLETQEPAASASPLTQADSALESGLKIARDCGYALYHIDLLIARARLHLLTGNPDAALDDIQMALGDENGNGGGIPANKKTGQPELLAARHGACGYAWPIPEGLQLKAEAVLLQAAQQLGTNKIESIQLADHTTQYKIGDTLVSDQITSLIEQAKALLNEALELWQPLHDPEPERDDQNFKLDGKDYNYKAAVAHQVDIDLNDGILSSYPLTPIQLDDDTMEHEMSALQIWIDKWHFLQKELATGSAQERFSIQEGIKECETKIVELGGTVPNTFDETQIEPKPKDDDGISKSDIRKLMDDVDHATLGLIAATLDIGVASSASRVDTMTAMLKWAETKERLQRLHNEILGQSNG